MKSVFDAFNDPAHGWIKVPISTLTELGITEKITRYSYMRGWFAYLEEDQDAMTLITALKAQGIEPRFKDHYADKRSKIRNYQPYEVHLTVCMECGKQTYVPNFPWKFATCPNCQRSEVNA